MENVSSGCYIIDSNYQVLFVNESIKSIYPQLRIGEKCYKCLMGRDNPCDLCPVSRNIMGPQYYLDPLRRITESVDAVRLEINGYGTCYALILSTVGNEAVFAEKLPSNAQELKNLSLIQALTLDYEDVFSVNLKEKTISLYRHNGNPVSAESVYRRIVNYEQGIRDYIDRYVYPDDRELVRERCDLENIRRVLRTSETMMIHYRVLIRGEVHYYFRKIARVGTSEDFENIVLGVGCEDDEVRERKRKTELKKNLAEVEYDPLTGLYTRTAFNLHAASLLRKNPGTPYDFCIAKVQNLVFINHQYGQAAGNRLLALIGRLLKTHETEENCIAYFGDGIFASYTVTDPKDVRMASVFAFRDRILAESEIKEIQLKWGIYVQAQSNISPEDTFRKTWYALSTIRFNAHEEYVEFDQKMIEQMEWDRSVEDDFERALADHEFVAWYQPKLSLETGKICGAEALVRWQKPDGGLIKPDRFIPILENCGKISQLDQYIFGVVCGIERQLSSLGIDNVPISVNLSRASLFTGDIAGNYGRIAAQNGISPRLVPIEITESAAVRAESLQLFAKELIERGFELHMDDFGAGYSSFSSLLMIPFSCIKLDKSMIDHIGHAKTDSLLRHTLSFVRENGISVVAEGVENEVQNAILKAFGCDMVQGFYFSRPLDENGFIAMLEKQQ